MPSFAPRDLRPRLQQGLLPLQRTVGVGVAQPFEVGQRLPGRGRVAGSAGVEHQLVEVVRRAVRGVPPAQPAERPGLPRQRERLVHVAPVVVQVRPLEQQDIPAILEPVAPDELLRHPVGALDDREFGRDGACRVVPDAQRVEDHLRRSFRGPAGQRPRDRDHGLGGPADQQEAAGLPHQRERLGPDVSQHLRQVRAPAVQLGRPHVVAEMVGPVAQAAVPFETDAQGGPGDAAERFRRHPPAPGSSRRSR
ncbi:hypothetical protein Aros01_06718 [Streptosporangium roseum]